MIQDLNEAVATCETLVSQQTTDASTAPADANIETTAPGAEAQLPTWTEACQLVGNILTSMGFIVEAYPWHSMALDILPNRRRFYSELGRVYSQCEVWDKAAYYCELILQQNPDNFKVRQHLSRIYHRLGDYRAESQTLNDLLSQKPLITTVQGHVDLGWIMQDQGQLPEAVSCFERAIEQDASFSAAYYALGDLYLRQGQTDEAIALFQRLVEQLSAEGLDENSAGQAATVPSDLSSDSLLSSSEAQLPKQPSEQTPEQPSEQTSEQTSATAKKVDRTSDRAMAYYRLGKAYRQAQQVEAAVTHFKTALEIDNRLHWAYMGLMNVLMQLEKWDEVVATCDGIIQAVEAFPWAYSFKGNALARKGELLGAAEAHRQSFVLRGWEQCAQQDYEFGFTWFGENIEDWERCFAPFNRLSKGPEEVRAPIHILSLGSSDVSSLCWLADRVLQQPQDKLTCITPDVSPSLQNNIARLSRNSEGHNDESKVVFVVGNMSAQLGELVAIARNSAAHEADIEESVETADDKKALAKFDVVYLQTGNKEGDFVRALAEQSWPLLRPAGLVIFKDYLWRHPTEAAKAARVGIDAFVESVSSTVEVLHQSHQIILKKLPKSAVRKAPVETAIPFPEHL